MLRIPVIRERCTCTYASKKLRRCKLKKKNWNDNEIIQDFLSHVIIIEFSLFRVTDWDNLQRPLNQKQYLCLRPRFISVISMKALVLAELMKNWTWVETEERIDYIATQMLINYYYTQESRTLDINCSPTHWPRDLRNKQ